jgi:hypothetical protein
MIKFLTKQLSVFIIALYSLYTGNFLWAQSQGTAVTQWKSFLPYNRVNAISYDDGTFFCGTQSGFFTYNRQDGTISSFSKVNGMADVGITSVATDGQTGQTVIAYSSSNIDLFKQDQFVNIPDIKQTQLSGDKTIYHVSAGDGLGYVSTGLGLVILNLTKKEIKETVNFYKESLLARVNATVTDDNNIYAATAIGLFMINKQHPFILNYLSWTLVDSNNYNLVTATPQGIYLTKNQLLYKLGTNNNIDLVKTMEYDIINLNAGANGLWIGTNKKMANNKYDSTGYCVLMNYNNANDILDTIYTTAATGVKTLGSGEEWYSDNSYKDREIKHEWGLRKRISKTESEAIIPDGPPTYLSADVVANNGNLWVVHGSKDVVWNNVYNTHMYSKCEDGKWTNYPVSAPLSGNGYYIDFIRATQDPLSKKVYLASFAGGIIARSTDGSVQEYRGTDYFSGAAGDDNFFKISGLAVDAAGNLWHTSMRGLNELGVITKDGRGFKMKSISNNALHTAADVIIDDNNQKWFIAPMGEGVVVYDDKGTIENTGDDQYRVLRTGKGTGGLPTSLTNCIAKDKDGSIWIGTENGIAIVKCPSEVIANNCEASLDVIQEDKFGGYLFMNQSIKSIAVDGANRKWVGTANGVWLVSENGEKTIYRFTEENSALPSNSIERINIDGITGDVYFSTDKGLVCFRSTATEGKEENDDPLFVYPNPVPSNYNGMIAIRGMAENSDVRITDIAGQLVYRTQALGGQAVWNGYDYLGKKAQSGVYLVFVVNKDGTQKTTTKFILQR